MTKRFYLVAPYYPLADIKKNIFVRIRDIFKPSSSLKVSDELFKNRLRELGKRVGHVQAALNSMGITSIQLDTEGLIELYYNIYNPQISESQPLVDLGKLNLETD